MSNREIVEDQNRVEEIGWIQEGSLNSQYYAEPKWPVGYLSL